jgi:predicted nucleic acid-binding protein
MLVLLDTNVLIYSVDALSPWHQESTTAVSRLRQRGDEPCVVSQNIYEFWAVATRPISARGLGFTTGQTQAELVRLKSIFVHLPDTPALYDEWERLVVQHSVAGKNTHDTRIAAAMLVHGVTHLLTYNVADFKRFAGITAIEPQAIT